MASGPVKDALLSCHYVSAFDLSDAHLDESLALIERHGIEYVMGYPGSLYYLTARLDPRFGVPKLRGFSLTYQA